MTTLSAPSDQFKSFYSYLNFTMPSTKLTSRKSLRGTVPALSLHLFVNNLYSSVYHIIPSVMIGFGKTSHHSIASDLTTTRCTTVRYAVRYKPTVVPLGLSDIGNNLNLKKLDDA